MLLWVWFTSHWSFISTLLGNVFSFSFYIDNLILYLEIVQYTHTHSRLNSVESFGPARAPDQNWSEWDHLVLFGHGIIMNNQCFKDVPGPRSSTFASWPDCARWRLRGGAIPKGGGWGSTAGAAALTSCREKKAFNHEWCENHYALDAKRVLFVVRHGQLIPWLRRKKQQVVPSGTGSCIEMYLKTSEKPWRNQKPHFNPGNASWFQDLKDLKRTLLLH